MENHEIKTVEMTRTIRDRHYQQLKGRSGSERISFYRQKAQALYAKLEKLARALLNSPKAS